ncbi:sulfite exporter TauE/SafE family protein 5-like [Heracleum sosnowskyi]|uniref:Sulfite exporter TauE/SafE family protein 5-like n=1 Tax=Heracleum sosnowskyi TaxID=360622 RepID=A0AAD8MD30_9APIA|nr:sulfite exporter TauE/SafE family protein 5-like [Heracleum sosnowskyi]
MSLPKKTSLCLHWIIFILIVIFIFNNNSQAKQTQHSPESLSSDLFFDTSSFRWILDLQQLQYTQIMFTFSSVISGVLCFLAASLSSAGGIGGGGLFIPILSIVAGFDLKTASSLSAFMVTGGSMANVLYNTVITSSNAEGKKGLINYDIALLSEPCMLLGVSIGVILNRVIPEWLITILFDVFLAWSSFKTCNAGVMFWNLESEDARREVCDSESKNCDRSEGNIECVLQPLLEEEKGKVAIIPLMKIGILTMIWFSFFFVNLLRGDRYRQSVIGIKPCGAEYWIISSTQIPVAIIFTIWILRRREGCNQNQNVHHQEMDDKTTCETTNKLTFPFIATLAGVLGGTYGIGGGMLISPILLQIGISPQVTAATCSFMVFFSSIMSAVQYLMLGMEHVYIALIYAGICFVASLIGLMVVQKIIRKHGRASLIVFSVGIVMILSTVLMTSFGASNVWKDYKSGRYMGFKPPC